MYGVSLEKVVLSTLGITMSERNMNYFEAIELLDKVKHGHPASIRDINFALFLTGDLDEELKFPIGCTINGPERKTEDRTPPITCARNHPNANTRSGQSPQMAEWIFEQRRQMGEGL